MSAMNPDNTLALSFAPRDGSGQKLEICIFTGESLNSALSSGADRIEFCGGSRASGGITPQLVDYIWIQSVCRTSPIPIHVMIRSVPDDHFMGIPPEQDLLEFSDLTPPNLRPAGFVFGMLTHDKKVDRENCKRLVDLAGPQFSCTFHRAFDLIARQEMVQELEVLIECGFKSVLTNGGGDATGAPNLAMLSSLVSAADGRIDIIVGGGIRSSNLAQYASIPGSKWFHSSAITSDDPESVSVDGEEVEKMKRIVGPQ